jgi:hypothetical protein
MCWSMISSSTSLEVDAPHRSHSTGVTRRRVTELGTSHVDRAQRLIGLPGEPRSSDAPARPRVARARGPSRGPGFADRGGDADTPPERGSRRSSTERSRGSRAGLELCVDACRATVDRAHARASSMAYPGASAQWTRTPEGIRLAEAKGRLNCLPRSACSATV